MQSSFLKDEIEKNQNSVFVSNEIKNLIDFNKENHNAVLKGKNNDFKCNIISYSRKNEQLHIKLHVDKKSLTEIICETFSQISIGSDQMIDLNEKIILFKAYLNKQQKLFIKLKVKV
jgi:ribosomal protein S4E